MKTGTPPGLALPFWDGQAQGLLPSKSGWSRDRPTTASASGSDACKGIHGPLASACSGWLTRDPLVQDERDHSHALHCAHTTARTAAAAPALT